MFGQFYNDLRLFHKCSSKNKSFFQIIKENSYSTDILLLLQLTFICEPENIAMPQSNLTMFRQLFMYKNLKKKVYSRLL